MGFAESGEANREGHHTVRDSLAVFAVWIAPWAALALIVGGELL